MILRCKCGAKFYADRETFDSIEEYGCIECGEVGKIRCTHEGAMHGECECGLDLTEHHDNEEEI